MPKTVRASLEDDVDPLIDTTQALELIGGRGGASEGGWDGCVDRWVGQVARTFSQTEMEIAANGIHLLEMHAGDMPKEIIKLWLPKERMNTDKDVSFEYVLEDIYSGTCSNCQKVFCVDCIKKNEDGTSSWSYILDGSEDPVPIDDDKKDGILGAILIVIFENNDQICTQNPIF